MFPQANPAANEQKNFIQVNSFEINYSQLKFGQELGEGGFGKVYAGQWQFQPVAVKKLLFKEYSQEAQTEFKNEANIMANLRHQNIVQFQGYCVSPEYCLVMEYMPKGSLFHVLHNAKETLQWETRYKIATGIASGLAYLHSQNILHRDIKSLNVLLDENFRSKLIDFGLSRIKTETRTKTLATKSKSTQSVGTLQWMAPELFDDCDNLQFTAKADIYSLGVTFWEIAARKIPFTNAANPNLIPRWVEKGKRETIPNDCPKKFKTLIEMCWKGKPDERPTAAEVAEYFYNPSDDFIQFLKDRTESKAADSRVDVASPAKRPTDPMPAPSIDGYQPNLASFFPPATIKEEIKQEQPKPTVDAQTLSRLLRLVAEGEQDQAEEMLKKDKNLALAAGKVTDLSERTFNNITAFQYACWAMDWHMWKMLHKYLPNAAAAEQLNALETKGTEHAKHFGLQPLIEALDTYIKNFDAWSWGQREAHWCKVVGGAQKLLPAHVVNEYCRPDRSFEPTPTFTEEKLPRVRQTDEGDWFEAVYNNGKIGERFALTRGRRRAVYGRDGYRRVAASSDHASLQNLSKARTQQLEELRSELSAYLPESVKPAGLRK